MYVYVCVGISGDKKNFQSHLLCLEFSLVTVRRESPHCLRDSVEFQQNEAYTVATDTLSAWRTRSRRRSDRSFRVLQFSRQYFYGSYNATSVCKFMANSSGGTGKEKTQAN